jgi:hypothetical protein
MPSEGTKARGATRSRRRGAPRNNSRYGSPSVLTAFYAAEYDDPDRRYYRRRTSSS